MMLATSCVLMASAKPTSYDFGYGVNDQSTGDVKEQQESKIGDQVSGHYKTLDADGLTRTVVYKSNPITGFQAHVSRQWSPDNADGIAAAPVVAPAVLPAVRVVRPATAITQAPAFVQNAAYPVAARVVRPAPHARLRSAALVRPQYAPVPIAETDYPSNVLRTRTSPVGLVPSPALDSRPYGLPPFTSEQSYGGYWETVLQPQRY